MTEFADQAKEVIAELRANHAAFDETAEMLRIDEVRCTTVKLLDSIKRLAETAAHEQFGQVQLSGVISEQQFDLGTVTLPEVQGEPLRFRVAKAHNTSWCYFLTLEGFSAGLADQAFVSVRRAIWVADAFDEFSSHSHHFVSWDGPREPRPVTEALAQPRTLVRDLTYLRTPEDISPWLLENGPSASSAIFDAWRMVALRWLVFSLPSEIRQEGVRIVVAPKGPRSVAIPIDDPLQDCTVDAFNSLMGAIHWIYSSQRHAETKFTFLNYHLSLDWQAGLRWPSGLWAILKDSLTSAKDTFRYDLQDQSKELLKTLADLRKALQDDVAKVQQSTRDLLLGLWRDFAIAGVVLALRTPSSSLPKEILQIVTVATAALLLVSIAVTLLSNARFSRLAAQGREVWRTRLYAFLPADDWDRLVTQPIETGQRVYRLVLAIITLVYAAIIIYLLHVAGLGPVANFLPRIVSALKWHMGG